DRAAKLAQGVHIAYTANLYPAMYAELEKQGCTITPFDTAPFIAATEEYRKNYIEKNGLQELVNKINAYE
ncbi:MAG: hypothetical protein IJU31_01630, partial [Synergistaceae bacterium]|nr:hypothetical protein [Synergistaceae bacterium]